MLCRNRWQVAGAGVCAFCRQAGKACAREGFWIILLNKTHHLFADVAAQIELITGVGSADEAAQLQSVFGEIGDLQAADFLVPERRGAHDPKQFQREAEYFAECIRQNRTPKSDGHEGLRDMALIDRIYRSAGVRS